MVVIHCKCCEANNFAASTASSIFVTSLPTPCTLSSLPPPYHFQTKKQSECIQPRKSLYWRTFPPTNWVTITAHDLAPNSDVAIDFGTKLMCAIFEVSESKLMMYTALSSAFAFVERVCSSYGARRNLIHICSIIFKLTVPWRFRAIHPFAKPRT